MKSRPILPLLVSGPVSSLPRFCLLKQRPVPDCDPEATVTSAARRGSWLGPQTESPG